MARYPIRFEETKAAGGVVRPSNSPPARQRPGSARLVLYRQDEIPIEGIIDLYFGGTGAAYTDGGFRARDAIATGTIFVDMNANGQVDEGELLDFSHHWARLREAK